MKVRKGQILWVDDEIDHLKSHILFLEEKGYAVTPVTNAEDAVALAKTRRFDLVLLDEMMPGNDGLQALSRLRAIHPSLPVIMITKSEEENLMEEAIGGEIDDYLTKPVNPSQILSSCKRILEKNRIARDKLTRDYTSEFGEISDRLGDDLGPDDWIEIHSRLSEREIELDPHPDLGLQQTLADQRRDCEQAFGRYIQANYEKWVKGTSGRPMCSVDLFEKVVAPPLRTGRKTLFVVVDNLRLDQWLAIEPLLYDRFHVDRRHYFSILPTATPYSRNAIFSGLFPSEIESWYPKFWKTSAEDESSLNRLEPQFMNDQLKRLGIELPSEPRYIKILDPEQARSLVKNRESVLSAPLTAMVFNFVDILVHRRSDSQILREIVPDESAYRSLTRAWFGRSALFQILKIASESGVRVVVTTDHGSIRTMRGSTVYADKETSTNIRFKYGKGIRGDSKQVIEVKDPRQFGLPTWGINTNYLIAKEDYYFVYPTNYHHYLSLYRDSFQHGGASMEEMILPVVVLEAVKPVGSNGR